jgi:hypothetical protein
MGSCGNVSATTGPAFVFCFGHSPSASSFPDLIGAQLRHRACWDPPNKSGDDGEKSRDDGEKKVGSRSGWYNTLISAFPTRKRFDLEYFFRELDAAAANRAEPPQPSFEARIGPVESAADPCRGESLSNHTLILLDQPVLRLRRGVGVPFGDQRVGAHHGAVGGGLG